MDRLCKHHGKTKFSLYGGKWRCLLCEVKRKKILLEKKKGWVNSFKQQPCNDCNLPWPTYVMDFHHRNRDEKIHSISRGIVTMGKENLLKEITKCDLLCANCHRIREYKEQLEGVLGSSPGLDPGYLVSSNLT